MPLTVAEPPVCSLAAAPSSVSLTLGQSTTAKLSCTITQGAFSAPLSLALSGLPSGVTAQESPATLTAGATTTVTLSAASTAKAGTTNVSLTAAGSGFTQTITLTLKAGSTVQVSLSSQLSGAFSSAVALSCTGLPTGVTVSFSKASLVAPGSGTSTVTFSATSATKAATYIINAMGTGGGVTQSEPITVIVTN